MKVIKYRLLSAEINHGTEENPDIERTFLEKTICCATAYVEANEEIAKAEAYKGEYTIEDDGQPEPEVQQTPEERIAELEAALELLLSGVTE